MTMALCIDGPLRGQFKKCDFHKWSYRTSKSKSELASIADYTPRPTDELEEVVYNLCTYSDRDYNESNFWTCGKSYPENLVNILLVIIEEQQKCLQ